MKHAREDYNRIQDPAGLIPADEPVFLLRGQDEFTPKMMALYVKLLTTKRNLLLRKSKNKRFLWETKILYEGAAAKLDRMIESTLVHSDRVNNWQVDVKCKTPDM